MSGDQGDCFLVIREYNATVGATEGNIIAAIITIQTVRNQPRVPRPVQGPSSIPCIWSAVHHQPAAASANNTTMSTRRVRTAENAGASPPRCGTRSIAGPLIASHGPGELRRRETGLALVLDAESVDPRALRLRHREIRTNRMEHAIESDGRTRLRAEGHDVLDLELDGVVDADAVTESVVVDFDRRAFDAEHLSDQGSQRTQRSAELPAEHLHELVELLVARLLVDEDAEPPIPLGHDLRRVGDRRDLQSGDVAALDVAFADVEHQRHPTEVVRGTVVHRQVARAHQLARAGLDVASLQVPSHRPTPSQSRIRRAR